ncbi:MAG: hypothetical protein DRG59_10595 [Deltaproteobacteria bacterium]|nr:MAG: hypothetical protein DRG59_10595 [Deltaproteobacteria bacterium]
MREYRKSKQDRIGAALLDSLKFLEDQPINDIVVGTHLLGVHSRQVGLASLVDPAGGHLKKIPDERYWKALEGKSAKEVATKIFEVNTFDVGLGLATISSLYDYSKLDFIKVKAQDIIAEKGRGKEVAIVGHFPFVTRIKKEFQKLWVIELKPQKGDIDTEEGYKVLPRCDVVGITATTIINKTLDNILRTCKPGSFKILLGPSTPMSEVLFGFGIDLLAGSRVVKKDVVFSGIRNGNPFRHLKGIETVCLLRS